MVTQIVQFDDSIELHLLEQTELQRKSEDEIAKIWKDRKHIPVYSSILPAKCNTGFINSIMEYEKRTSCTYVKPFAAAYIRWCNHV